MKVETKFEFVRFSIGSIGQFTPNEEINWEEMYEFAKKQTIIGVLFMGIEKLPKERRPEKKLLMKWYAQTERIKQKNDELNEAVIAVTRQFTNDGFLNCVLKGQGNAQMYPNPSLRTPGDIDLWPLADRGKIYKYVRKDFPETEMLYHHLEYPKIKGIVTEVHFSPMFMNNPLYNWRFQKWVKSVGRAQCKNEVTLPQGVFCRPTDEFNVVYQLAHIRHHFFDEGIGLRQMTDYYYLVKNERLMAKRPEMLKLLKQFGLLGFAKAVMYVMKEVLGLDERFLLVEPDMKVGRMLVEEIIMTGNFGHEDSRYGNLKKGPRVKRLATLLKKNMRFYKAFPGEVIFAFLFRLNQPVWRCWAKYKYAQ